MAPGAAAAWKDDCAAAFRLETRVAGSVAVVDAGVGAVAITLAGSATHAVVEAVADVVVVDEPRFEADGLEEHEANSRPAANGANKTRDMCGPFDLRVPVMVGHLPS